MPATSQPAGKVNAKGNTTYGSGYNEAKSLLDGNAALPESFGLLKMPATVVSYVSGIPGGIMAPSLSAGAGFGANIAHFFTSVPAGATIILGMAAALIAKTCSRLVCPTPLFHTIANNFIRKQVPVAKIEASKTAG